MQLAPGQRLLDVGCGTGTLAVLAQQRHPGVEVHAALGCDAGSLRGSNAEKSPHFAALFSGEIEQGGGETGSILKISLPVSPPPCEFSEEFEGMPQGQTHFRPAGGTTGMDAHGEPGLPSTVFAR
ncbi:SAM-dependent methyltransferase [Sorangium sp. So ce1128]